MSLLSSAAVNRLCSGLLLVSLAVPFAADLAHADGGRTRTVVLGLQGRRGVDDKALMAALSDVVQGIYTDDPRRVVIGRTDLERLMELETSKQMLGCDTDSCLAEIGQALDVSRVVSGTVDAIGGDFLVTLVELDVKASAPVGRVQEQIKKDEALLLSTVRSMAQKLRGQSGVHVAAATGLLAAAGNLDIKSDPRGGTLTVDGQPMGQTPQKIDNLVPGSHKVRITYKDYETLDLDAPVFAGGTTVVNAELRLSRSVGEQNYRVRLDRHKDDTLWHGVGAWSKSIGGGVVASLGGLALAGGLLGGDVGTLVAGVVVGSAGAGLIAWGVYDFINPPEAPVPDWEVKRAVTITPPKGQGVEQVRVIQASPAPAAER